MLLCILEAFLFTVSQRSLAAYIPGFQALFTVAIIPRLGFPKEPCKDVASALGQKERQTEPPLPHSCWDCN